MKQSFTTGMRSDDLAGAAERRVPIPRGGALVKQSFTTGMRSDDLAGAAERRVPIPKRGRRKYRRWTHLSLAASWICWFV